MAIDLVGFGIVLPILPIYAKRFHASVAARPPCWSPPSRPPASCCSPLWGRVSDRVGRKPGPAAVAGRHRGRQPAHRPGRRPAAAVRRADHRRRLGRQRLGGPGGGDRRGHPREPRPRLFGLLGAAFGVGFVAGPALGALAALGGTPGALLRGRRPRRVNAVVALRRLPETRPPGLRPRRPRRPGPLARLGRRTRGWSPLLGVAFCALAVPSAPSRPPSPCSGRRRLGLRDRLVGRRLRRHRPGDRGRPGRSGPARGGPLRGEAARSSGGLLANAAGLVVLAVAQSWARAVPALLPLTVGQGLVQTTMSSSLAGAAGPGRAGPGCSELSSRPGAWAGSSGRRSAGALLGAARLGRALPVRGGADAGGGCALVLRPGPAGRPTWHRRPERMLLWGN